MRRALPLAAVVLALLACSASALAATAGHNGPTKRLEAAFKVALFERAGSPDGCYPAPAPLAAALRKKGFKTAVAVGLSAVQRAGVVYVVRRGARCDHTLLALRAKGRLWVLNSTQGTVSAVGGGRGRDQSEPGGNGPLRALTFATRSFRMTRHDQAQRLEVICPRGTFPLGGGMGRAARPPGPDGEGIYPHSYERLGAQRGWHINPVLIDPTVITNPSNPDTTPREVTLQVVCGKGLVPTSSPRKTAFLRPGETKTVVARCPKGSYLLSGGFQRTNFATVGGDYVTEARAIGGKAWRVSGRAFGDFGGELTAIAYCDRSKRPLLTEVSASTPLPAGQLATATTPPCPKGRRLTSGGFSANGSQDTFFSGGSINRNGTWSATSFGFFGPAPALTAYGYCLRPGR